MTVNFSFSFYRFDRDFLTLPLEYFSNISLSLSLSLSFPFDVCIFQLRNVAINGLPEARSWEEQLAARALRFSWIDGEITDVCHHPEEEEWVINVKKAIISSLQVVGTNGYVSKVERDILGDCQTV